MYRALRVLLVIPDNGKYMRGFVAMLSNRGYLFLVPALSVNYLQSVNCVYG